MIVAAVKEKNEFENRVSITPDTCKSYIKAGLDVIIEKNAGYNASFLDSFYKDSGAKILDREQVLQKADILISVSTILENSDLEILKNKAVIVGGFNPYENSDKIKQIVGKFVEVYVFQSFFKFDEMKSDQMSQNLRDWSSGRLADCC